MKTDKMMKELRRAIKYLTEEVIEDTNWNYLTKIYDFNIFYIQLAEENNFYFLEKSKNQTLILENYLNKIGSALEIPLHQIKITTKVILKPNS